MQTIKFLQIAIAQDEYNKKYNDFFHCSIGLNLETNELTRIYPVQKSSMYKHCVYDIEVEPMSCRRERSFKPIKMRFLYKIDPQKTNELLNKIEVQSIEKLNELRLSMGIVDVSSKKIIVESNEHEFHDLQLCAFDETVISKPMKRNHAARVRKDIKIKFKCKYTKQGYHELKYHEEHFYLGLERNGSLPTYYDTPKWNRMIVGNLADCRNIFIGLCLFKSNQ